MKKTLLNILLGASLTFGAGNQLKAQEENVKFYNHDEDEFSEEVIGVKRDGLNEKKTMYENNKMGLTIIYYSDKNNDNFHESIRIFNCDKIRRIVTEEFYIDKNTGLIDYSWKKCAINRNKWNKFYAGKQRIDIVKNDSPYEQNCTKGYHPYLTKEDLERFGWAERFKRLINVGASGNRKELEILAEQERKWSKTH